MLRIGVDLGGTKTEGIVMDATGNILLQQRRPTPQAEGYAAILANIRDLVLNLERRAGEPCRVGLATPGALSTQTGDRHGWRKCGARSRPYGDKRRSSFSAFLKNSNTVCLNGSPVKNDLETLLQREIRIANDANCFALSEALDGAAKDTPVVFGVILGTGVGGGIVVNGRLVEGAQRIAGEWGHNVLEADGPPCYCGKRGCVETFLSGPGLVHDYRTAGGDPLLDARAIAAAGGDPLAEATMQRYLDRFGRALSVVINILDPDAIVLGGGLSNIARLYTEGVAQVARNVFNDALHTRLLPNLHGDSSGVRGAAQLWAMGEPAQDG